MKTLFLFLTLLILLLLPVTSCTQKERVRHFGGNAKIELPKGQKLINTTWKENDLWLLTKPMTSKDSAETYVFFEDSSWGVWEGSYTIVEIK